MGQIADEVARQKRKNRVKSAARKLGLDVEALGVQFDSDEAGAMEATNVIAQASDSVPGGDAAATG